MPAEPEPDVGQPSESTAPTFAHVRGLDGLRGAAVAAVLVYHAGHFTGGYLGVDLFFVLSGYLITSLLLVEYQRYGRIDLKAFWGRRMRRLLPALFVVLAGAAAYARWVARPIDFADIRGDAFATLAYVANWHTIIKGSDYWDISKAPSPLQHTWSLAIEEQFYVLWPLVVWGLVVLVRRRREGAKRSKTADHQHLESLVARVAVIGTIAAFGLFVGLHLLGASTTRLYEGTDTRAGAILGGVALAVWAKRRRDRSDHESRGVSLPVEVGGIVAALALGVMWARLDGESPWLYRGLLPVASLLAVVVIAAVADPRSPVLGRVFSFAPLRWLGLISYGLYLWHWPIYQALEARNGNYPFLGTRTLTDGELLVAKFVLSLAVAAVSYVVIEQPIRHGRMPKRLRIPATAVAVVAVTALVTAATQTDVKGPSTEKAAVKADVEVKGAPVMLALGDSVANSVMLPIVEDPESFGVNPINRTRLGCSEVAIDVEWRNFLGGEGKQPVSCRGDLTTAEVAKIDPDVALFEAGARPNDFIVLDGEPVQACDPAFDARYRLRLSEVVDLLGSSGAKVGVANVLHSGKNSIRVDGSEERIDCVNRIIQEVVETKPFAFVVDVDRFLCPQGAGSCKEELDGGTVRSDGLHFDPGPGGEAMSRFIVEQLLAAR